jgi:hypothetical protein
VHDGSSLYEIAPPDAVGELLEEVHLSWRGGNHYNYLQAQQGHS